MKTLRQTNIKNSQNYFCSSMTNIKNFDPSLLSIDQIPFKGIDFFTYNIISIILIVKILSISFSII